MFARALMLKGMRITPTQQAGHLLLLVASDAPFRHRVNPIYCRWLLSFSPLSRVIIQEYSRRRTLKYSCNVFTLPENKIRTVTSCLSIN